MTDLESCEKAGINWYGRTHYDPAEKIHWFNMVCSGFSFSFDGTGACGVLKAQCYDSERNRPYIAVLTDGEKDPHKAKIVALTQKENAVVFAENLKKGRHTVQVVKITEQTVDDEGSSRVGLMGLTTDGRFVLPPAKSEKRIEFFGDSITCGYGVSAADESEFRTRTENGLLSYAGLSAAMLGADAHMVCASGWPLLKNGWNDAKLFPRFDKTDFSCDDAWDFGIFSPQVVVINLGTNDEHYLSSLWGEEKKKAKSEYLGAYENFVRRIDETYAGVEIVAAWGMACPPDAQANDGEWLAMLARLRSEGIRVTPLRLSGMLQYPQDVRLGHPGPDTHKKAAEELAAHISAVTGWKIERRL